MHFHKIVQQENEDHRDLAATFCHGPTDRAVGTHPTPSTCWPLGMFMLLFLKINTSKHTHTK